VKALRRAKNDKIDDIGELEEIIVDA